MMMRILILILTLVVNIGCAAQSQNTNLSMPMDMDGNHVQQTRGTYLKNFPDRVEYYKDNKLHRNGGPAVVYNNGFVRWCKDGFCYREVHPNGNVAEKYPNGTVKFTKKNGTVEYRFNGRLHRNDGPAVEHWNGDREWYLNGQLHRINGPAVERADGSERWYKNGIIHREGGPAITEVDIERNTLTKIFIENGNVILQSWLLHKDRDSFYWENQYGAGRFYVRCSGIGPTRPTEPRTGPSYLLSQGCQLHKEDGPALIFTNGNKRWLQNGKYHRDNGPAYEGADGCNGWWNHGLRHRKNGPAVECENGDKQWYENGVALRFENADGSKAWFNNDGTLTPIDDDDYDFGYHSVGSISKQLTSYGTTIIYRNEKIWDTSGPIIDDDDGKFWFKNGKLVKFTTNYGTTVWFGPDEEIIKTDGPYIGEDGNKRWFMNGRVVKVETETDTMWFGWDGKPTKAIINGAKVVFTGNTRRITFPDGKTATCMGEKCTYYFPDGDIVKEYGDYTQTIQPNGVKIWSYKGARYRIDLPSGESIY